MVISLQNKHLCHSAQQTKQHTSNIRAACNFHLARKNERITIDCDECSTYWQYKAIAKKTLPPSFVTSWITLRKISLWKSNQYPDPIFFKNWIFKSNPDPKKSQVSDRISNLDPVHAHLCWQLGFLTNLASNRKCGLLHLGHAEALNNII